MMSKMALWLENICDSLLDKWTDYYFLTKPNSDFNPHTHTQLSLYKFLQGRQQMNCMKWVITASTSFPVFLATYHSPFRHITHDSADQNIFKNSLKCKKKRMTHTKTMFTHLWPSASAMKPFDRFSCNLGNEFCTKIVEQALVLWECLSDGHTVLQNINKFYTYVPPFLANLNKIQGIPHSCVKMGA
jgi:hypothetical protein